MALRMQRLTWQDQIEQIYIEAKDLGLIHKAKAGKFSYEYAALSTDDRFSFSTNNFINWWGQYWIGKTSNAKNYVFCDFIPEELHDQVGLHTALTNEAKITATPNLSPFDEHNIACREQLRFLEQNPELYGKLAEFVVSIEQGKYELEDRFGDVSHIGYFSGEIEDLDSIIREGRMSPVELLKTHQQILNDKYKSVPQVVEF